MNNEAGGLMCVFLRQGINLSESSAENLIEVLNALTHYILSISEVPQYNENYVWKSGGDQVVALAVIGLVVLEWC